ncbi:hypothetical protein CDL12_29946 [Handroanthus impetiginosus]|uniref:Uncharacterized protein n=1 Tax=Handroanthus impetiginosus TaxID=429701 RepID=A0A2G9FX09_9LAMI|nr:hypothetical protein CDL12_29946 [Handroanthus impetiginosus]
MAREGGERTEDIAWSGRRATAALGGPRERSGRRESPELDSEPSPHDSDPIKVLNSISGFGKANRFIAQFGRRSVVNEPPLVDFKVCQLIHYQR